MCWDQPSIRRRHKPIAKFGGAKASALGKKPATVKLQATPTQARDGRNGETL